MRRINKNNIRAKLAVSEIFGTVLMLGIATSFFSILYYNVVNAPNPIPSPIVEISGMIEDNQLIITHCGGEPLDLDTELTLNVGGNLMMFKVGDFLDSNSKEDGVWSLDEDIVYPIEYDFDYSLYPNIEINVIDRFSNSIVMTGITKVNPTCDLGVMLTVDNINPKENENVLFNLIVTNYENINASGVLIEFLLPEGLTFVSCNMTQGLYNSSNGIWDVGQLKGGESAVLIVKASIGDIIYGGPTQLAVLLDGSGSIKPTNWALMLKGLSAAVKKKSSFLHSGVMELTVIQFGGKNNACAKLEIAPIVINQSNIDFIVDKIQKIVQMGDRTPTSCAVYMAADVLKASDMFDPDIKQVILLVTDGNPTHSCINDGDYIIDNAVGPKDAVVVARDYLVKLLNLSENDDSFNALSIELSGTGHTYDLRDEIVWPQPGYETTDFSNYIPNRGWVRNIKTWEEFADSINASFEIIFNNIPVKVFIKSTAFLDPKIVNDVSFVILEPLP